DLGDHRQVDPDHVALADAPRLQPVGQPLHVGEQPGVGQVALFALLAAPVERDPVAVARLNVPVPAVVGGVEPAVGDPGVEGRVAVAEHGAERRLPAQPLPCLLGPPGRGVLGRLLVHRLVAHLRVGGEVWRRRELPDLQQLLEAFLDGWLRSRHGCFPPRWVFAGLAPRQTANSAARVAAGPPGRPGDGRPTPDGAAVTDHMPPAPFAPWVPQPLPIWAAQTRRCSTTLDKTHTWALTWYGCHTHHIARPAPGARG